VLSLALLGGLALMPSPSPPRTPQASAARTTNRDGVIHAPSGEATTVVPPARSNNDGVLAGEGNCAAGNGIVQDFALVDLDGNGRVTAQEWRRAFHQLTSIATAHSPKTNSLRTAR
jgi:hypothetical protein